MRNLLCYIAPLHKLLRYVMEFLGILEFLPASLLIEKLVMDHIGQFCVKLHLRGPVEREMIQRICKHAKTSKISFYTLLHYGQNITDKCFHAYDWYDSEENIKRYGSQEAPTYQLSEVTVPLALFWSPKDNLSSRGDVERIVKDVPRVVHCKEVKLGHLDYLWRTTVKEDIYFDVLNLLNSANS